MSPPLSPPKSLPERVAQALAFEALAILVCTPLFGWLFDTGWAAMGVVTLANCLIALAWNVAFNAGFDRALAALGRRATPWTRLVHALLFEGGLVLLCVPFAVWWLHISWVEALLLDAGMLAFFLPYTYTFHWGWDRARQRFISRRGPGPAAPHSSPGL